MGPLLLFDLCTSMSEEKDWKQLLPLPPPRPRRHVPMAGEAQIVRGREPVSGNG